MTDSHDPPDPAPEPGWRPPVPPAPAVPPAAWRAHINELVRCKCLPDLLALKLFPNAKEMTESQAAFAAARKYLSDFACGLGNPRACVICVGDGHTPRTAALFAFRTAWQTIAIDPRLRNTDWDVRRLACFRSKVEECGNWHLPSPLIIVGVHPHASLKATLTALEAERRAVVWIPCCLPVDIAQPPDVDYRDLGIWSPHNRVMIWRQI